MITYVAHNTKLNPDLEIIEDYVGPTAAKQPRQTVTNIELEAETETDTESVSDTILSLHDTNSSIGFGEKVESEERR